MRLLCVQKCGNCDDVVDFRSCGDFFPSVSAYFPLWARIVCHEIFFLNGKVWKREGKQTGSAFTSGPLLLRIIDHYHLCDLEWDKGKRWLHLENQTGSVRD